MEFLDEVRNERQKLADILSNPEYSGIRSFVEDLYPDRAHFIYELLQNAEDAGATEVLFNLQSHSLTFQHNGRPFTQDDIWAITNIGKGTKAGDGGKIGQFGVGFKSVFLYSETPTIYSPTFSFKIRQLVLPFPVPPPTLPELETRFEFPFNNPKKAESVAYAEVENGLEELEETTLLFLSRVRRIKWSIPGVGTSEVCRLNHSENHVEVRKVVGENIIASSHFLLFKEPVRSLPEQYVALAYEMDLLPNSPQFQHDLPLLQQFNIWPAEPGRVAVFFPAEKESSGLHFHLHAPFVPELSRASIKDTDANLPLYHELSQLAAKSLHSIRDLGLLTRDFLRVLPSASDNIPPRYEPIREAVVSEMNQHPLTPTQCKDFAPASTLLQAKASLKKLLNNDDLRFLRASTSDIRWAIGAPQKNGRIDRFLNSLAVTNWDIDEFLQKVYSNTSLWRGLVSEQFLDWLSSKSPQWHERLYTLLFNELNLAKELKDLKELKIVRLKSGDYETGEESFFPDLEGATNSTLPQVDPLILVEAQSLASQSNAREFLEKIGVREIGEAEQVQNLLEKRYNQSENQIDLEVYKNDLLRFIELTEDDSDSAKLFSEFFIFRLEADWGKPSQVYLDTPFLETGLKEYYDRFEDDSETKFHSGASRTVIRQLQPLSASYLDIGVSVARIATFAKLVGAATGLQIVKTTCEKNLKWEDLRKAGGRSVSPINQDFIIPFLDSFFKEPTLDLSQLVWRTMNSAPRYPDDPLRAQFRQNKASGSKYAPSQLVCLLRSVAWIPQGSEFVRPIHADADRLPEGFLYDSGKDWLDSIDFGKEARVREEEIIEKEQAAQDLGFGNLKTLERAREFAALPEVEQERFLKQIRDIEPFELPDQEPGNPSNRSEKVARRAAQAPEKETDIRKRSVSVEREEIKKEAEQYLRSQYTNHDEEMICQICKRPLPFKLDDGQFYFERVEFLPKLKRRHYQNYLALCPNHSAMFLHANQSKKELKKRFRQMSGNRLEVELARKLLSIYFTKTHVLDLKAVLDSEQG